MSDEICTPMNAILGFTTLLESLIEDKLQKEYLASGAEGRGSTFQVILKKVGVASVTTPEEQEEKKLECSGLRKDVRIAQTV